VVADLSRKNRWTKKIARMSYLGIYWQDLTVQALDGIL
jgi:hypothetical protein